MQTIKISGKLSSKNETDMATDKFQSCRFSVLKYYLLNFSTTRTHKFLRISASGMLINQNNQKHKFVCDTPKNRFFFSTVKINL